MPTDSDDRAGASSHDGPRSAEPAEDAASSEQAASLDGRPVADPDVPPEGPSSGARPPADPTSVAPSSVDADRAVRIIDVTDLDGRALAAAVDPAGLRARMRAIVESTEALLDRVGGPGMLFDDARAHADDRVLQVKAGGDGDADAGDEALWIIGDLHGDLLALEAALAYIALQPSPERICAAGSDSAGAGDSAGDRAIDAHLPPNGTGAATSPRSLPRIVFLGDFFDDEGLGLEVLLRVYELVLASPERVCIVAGNHDEALSFDGARFASTVTPSDFADHLNAERAHEWIERTGKLAIRMTARAPRALFMPDGLLIAHGGFPLVDLHARLEATGDWNDPACLSDFVWARAHPKARRKMPNRHSRGSQFGHEDLADFCALAGRLGRPVRCMVRGHDHVEDRYAVYPAYARHPLVTTVALSRRLPREPFGPDARVPTVVRCAPGRMPEVHRLHVPPALVAAVFPSTAAAASEGAPSAVTPEGASP